MDYINCHPQYMNTVNPDIQFQKACGFGNLSLIHFLLVDLPPKKRAYIDCADNYGFINACQNGQLEVIKYLLFSPELKTHTKLEHVDEKVFITTIQNGHIDIIKYLVELKIEMKQDIPIDSLLELSCYHNKTNILHYVLNHPILKKTANIHNNNDRCFEKALMMNSEDIMNCLIVDYNLDKTERISTLLERSQLHMLYEEQQRNIKRYHAIQALFKSRDLKNKLEEKLEENSINNNNNRIKI